MSQLDEALEKLPNRTVTKEAIKALILEIVGEDATGWTNFGKRELTKTEEQINRIKDRQREEVKEL